MRKGEGSGVATSDPLSKERTDVRPKDDPPPFDADAT
jgi:sec-independent protein translocase protein TatB